MCIRFIRLSVVYCHRGCHNVGQLAESTQPHQLPKSLLWGFSPTLSSSRRNGSVKPKTIKGCFVLILYIVLCARINIVVVSVIIAELLSACIRARRYCLIRVFTCVASVAGVGKGLIGAVVLPTSGVIDFGTRAFEGVHRFFVYLLIVFVTTAAAASACPLHK